MDFGAKIFIDLMMIIGGIVGVIFYVYLPKSEGSPFKESLMYGNYLMIAVGVIGIIRLLYDLLMLI